ncbi:MAG: guanylate kinase [Pirellulaceae bacterium]|nr:guanylate kinase [Pirellulaceae bacterium]
MSGPSGAGKSTVVRGLLQHCPLPIQLSVSVTTRSPRPGEVSGREYHFVSREKFQQLRAEDAFLECKEVFGCGDWYGTLRSTVTDGLAVGNWVLLEIDVQGALSVLEQYPQAISIFIHPGSLSELEQRLRGRGTDSEQAIARRLEVAAQELLALPRYRYEIVNHQVEQSVTQICQLLQQLSQETTHARST